MNKEKSNSWRDADIELLLSRVMRYGIVLASVIVITGCVLFLANHGSASPHYSKFTGQPAQFRNVWGIISSLSDMNGSGIIEFGLLVLIAIPLVRVAFSVVSFAAEKDNAYLIITLLVLALLLFSFFIGH